MPLKPRSLISRLKKSTHGGLDHAEMAALGIDPEGIIDFSVSTNPFMPPPGIKEIIGTIRIDRYPDSRCTELRRLLAAKLGVSTDNLLVGSGTTELIRLVTATFLRQGDPVLLLEPTYGDYEVACRMAGAGLIRHRSREEDGFLPRTEEVTRLIRQRRPRAVFICNPGNPAGRYISRTDIEIIVREMAGGLLILDEAYLSFVERQWDSLGLISGGNVIVLRSMTKDYGLPGLRLGYAVASREIISAMLPVLPPWNVNSIAQEVGAAVLGNEEYLRQSLRKVNEAKHFLMSELSRINLKVLPSDANYFLVKVGDARECRLAFLKHGILVRDCSSFGLPGYIRLSARTLTECEQLLEAARQIIRGGEYRFSPGT
ncbi:MAG: hypothetical protein A2Z29_06745 [Chloroflexi bacterium RBG_16_56_11]|nr:MAG: hypothetical protein A2Z29_06745 [Chloroflexi bacterium RBG_16_56_11]